MGLETATYVSQLVATNPTTSDPLAQGDDHIRLLKAVIKATLPTLNGPLNALLVPFTPAAGIVATTVAGALAELAGRTVDVSGLAPKTGVGATGTWPISITGASTSCSGAAASVPWAGVTSKPFNWSGLGGQPSWLWGGNAPDNYNVYNPSNFSVNYATSAGNADTVDGQHASAFAAAGHGHSYAGLNAVVAITGHLAVSGVMVATQASGSTFTFSAPNYG